MVATEFPTLKRHSAEFNLIVADAMKAARLAMAE
jgi:hypothetical protein